MRVLFNDHCRIYSFRTKLQIDFRDLSQKLHCETNNKRVTCCETEPTAMTTQLDTVAKDSFHRSNSTLKTSVAGIFSLLRVAKTGSHPFMAINI